jgi:hypothetical protein
MVRRPAPPSSRLRRPFPSFRRQGGRPVFCVRLGRRQQALQGKRRPGHRPDGERHQREFVVVSRYPVRVKLAAGAAPVDDGPVTARADPDGDRLHRTLARGGAIAGILVHVAAPQAPRAVVAVQGPRGLLHHRLPAADAAKPIPTPGFTPLTAFFRSQRNLSCNVDPWVTSTLQPESTESAGEAGGRPRVEAQAAPRVARRDCPRGGLRSPGERRRSVWKTRSRLRERLAGYPGKHTGAFYGVGGQASAGDTVAL